MPLPATVYLTHPHYHTTHWCARVAGQGQQPTRRLTWRLTLLHLPVCLYLLEQVPRDVCNTHVLEQARCRSCYAYTRRAGRHPPHLCRAGVAVQQLDGRCRLRVASHGISLNVASRDSRTGSTEHLLLHHTPTRATLYYYHSLCACATRTRYPMTFTSLQHTQCTGAAGKEKGAVSMPKKKKRRTVPFL